MNPLANPPQFLHQTGALAQGSLDPVRSAADLFDERLGTKTPGRFLLMNRAMEADFSGSTPASTGTQRRPPVS